MTDNAIQPSSHRSAEPSLRARRDSATGSVQSGFRETMERVARVTDPTTAERMVRSAATSIERGERMINGVIAVARRGQSFTNEQLIAVQAGVYRYAQELDLASKLVDKLANAVRQTIQSQQ
ncbi:MAG: hypothetical protein IPK60_02030 [Sandaracinaceae bacterium]|nr:hypothetical protein [Sandaracinaceae bacterium]